KLQGDAQGTIENFSIKKMIVKTGGAYVDGDLAMRGLPNIKSTFIDFTSRSLRSSYAELSHIIPQLNKITSPDIKSLGNINFAGNFTGFLDDFVTFGTLRSNLGVIKADLNMKLPEGGTPAYSGILSSEKFNIGKFLKNNSLGSISLNGRVDGKGFDIKTINTNFKGTVHSIDFAKKNFTNIDIIGTFTKKKFNGRFNINDPKLKIKDLNGMLDFSGDDMIINAVADVQYADLKQLGISKNNIGLKGSLNVNFKGNNIDDFLGTASIYNASLQTDATTLIVDSVILSSLKINDKKILRLHTSELDAEIEGKFSIVDLPNSFKFFLSRYYPAYIGKPTYAVSNQDFIFNVRTKNIDKFLPLIDSRIDGLNNSTISGSLNLVKSELVLHAKVPMFSYDNKEFTNVILNADGNIDTLKADFAIDNIKISDSLSFPDTRINISANNNLSFINIKTSAAKTLNDAELNASVLTMNDGVKINFFPSSFIINGKKWLLEKDGELTLRKKYIDANEIKFVHNNQHIIISSELSDVTSDAHIIAKLQNVNIEDFTPFLFKKPELKGILTGTATLIDPFDKMRVLFSGVADSFSLNQKYIGAVNILGDANTQSGLVSFSANSKDSGYVFDVNGSYNYKDSTQSLAIDLQAEKINLDVLQPYLSSVFSEISGIATTKLKISGPTNHLLLTGEATIDSGAIKIGYTQVKYLIKNETLIFRPDEIDLGRMRITDTLNNEGVISGKMRHTFFQKFSFENLLFETQRMVLLNTTKKDNEQFYGNVTGYGLMNLNGPITDMVLNIDGQPSSLDSSHIYLPTGTTKESNAVDYIEFIQFGELMESQRTSELANILVNLNIVANPAVKIDVILDETTGDVIKGQGNGAINIRVGTKEPLSIRGRYELTKGEYTFNFQTFLKKPFTLSRGTITWNGDPYDAQIDIEAEYLAKNVDVSSLASAGGFRQKEDVTIISHLTGVLKQPVIEFSF
ncbi:MAG: translocation/assembly module TamB domain-containing protein, partial [Ferruginibacter sp.]